MRRRLILGSIASLMIVLLAAESADAQGWGRGGRWRNSVTLNTPYFSFDYGRPYYYDRYYYGPNYYDNYYRGNRYYDAYYSTPRFYERYTSYPPYGSTYRYYEPNYYYYSSTPWWGPGGASNQQWVAPQSNTSQYTSNNNQDENRSYQNRAPIFLRVIVTDPTARVWVGDHETQQRGFDRLYVSPPMEPNRDFVYKVRVTWQDNGREMSQEREVPVRVGQHGFVDLMQKERIDRPRDPGPRTPAIDENSENPQRAKPPVASQQKAHEGKVVQASQNKLTMTDVNGANQHSHLVPSSATITCDGTPCKLEDLREGYHVAVTMDEANNTVTRIEAKSSTK